MSAKYKLVKRKDFSKDAPEDAIKYFAQLVNNGTVGFEEICGDVAEETALTSADVKSCIEAYKTPSVLCKAATTVRKACCR